MNQSEIDRLIESKVHLRKPTGPARRVGHYDVKFPTKIVIDGEKHTHSAYNTWNNMLQRCYTPPTEHLARNYAGCAVADEWMYFSNFLAFWKASHREGYALDKDLLYPGNKSYSAEHCLFIPQALNNFTVDHAHARGDFPQGVYRNTPRGKFQARINVNGKKKHLGYFDNPQAAHLSWHAAKMQLAMQWKQECDLIHPNLHAGLIRKVQSMLEVLAIS
ncbi:hypothetical protein K5N94_004654 [Salmonella enterica]|nr:hypothetical protein [Salmonella enterica]